MKRWFWAHSRSMIWEWTNDSGVEMSRWLCLDGTYESESSYRLSDMINDHEELVPEWSKSDPALEVHEGL